MKSIRVWLLLFPLAFPAFAQKAPAPVAVKTAAVAPTLKKRPDTLPLSSTETLAIASIAEKLQARQKDLDDVLDSLPQSTAKKILTALNEKQQLLDALKAVEAEFAIEHPGYHFEEATGKGVKDVKDTPAATDKPAPAETPAVTK